MVNLLLVHPKCLNIFDYISLLYFLPLKLLLLIFLPSIALGQQNFATFYGGTSLLIMVGVILDTLQQIETQLLMRQYDGLMTGGGRIQGRQAATVGGM